MAPGGQGTLVNICNSTVRVLPQDPALLHSRISSEATGQPMAKLGWEGNSIGQARKRPRALGLMVATETIITEGETEDQGGGRLV